MREYTQNILIAETKESPKVQSFLKSIHNPGSRQQVGYGLSFFNTYLTKEENTNIDSIIETIKQNKEKDEYDILQGFVNFLTEYISPKTGKLLDSVTIGGYLTSVKSFLGFFKIYIIPQIFKYRVKLPRKIKRRIPAIDEKDLRKILTHCNSPRLRAYLFILATGGTRATETCSIRLCDIDFNTEPTTIHLRGEYTKTKEDRDFFITNEATHYLKEWIEHKYRPRDKKEDNIARNNEDLIFTVYDKETENLKGLYSTLSGDFNYILKAIGVDQKRSGGRRKVTLHGIRAYVYSKWSDTDSQFAEWCIGHRNSTYWRKSDAVLRQKYLEGMKYLTLLDWDAVKKEGENTQAKLKEQEQEIAQLKEQVKDIRPWMLQLIKDMKDKEKMAELEKDSQFTIEYAIDKPKK